MIDEEVEELNFLISSNLTKKDNKNADRLLESLRKDVDAKKINLDEANKYIKSLKKDKIFYFVLGMFCLTAFMCGIAFFWILLYLLA